MNLILCGMPKSGKSMLGKKLGHQLEKNFFDLDDLVEKRFKSKTNQFQTCREIYLNHGEPYFRKLEEEALEALLDEKITHSIIALGGGALLSPKIQHIVSSLGTLVYLKAPEKLLWQRISEKEIPAPFQGEDPEALFREQMALREATFTKLSQHTVEVATQSKKELLETLKQLWTQHGLK